MRGVIASWLFGFLLLGTPSAFAIDQVILSNGEVIEGTVLNDVPNRHVDLRLANGTTRRFLKKEVASVERDVPSTKDSSLRGNQSQFFISALAGGYLSLPMNGTNPLFDVGGKFGLKISTLDFAWLVVAASYDYVSSSNAGNLISISSAYHDFNLQLNLARMGNSGFYLGGNGGIAVFSSSFGGVGLGSSSTFFEAGAQAGYDLFLGDAFSIGPEVRFEHLFTRDSNVLKFALAASVHF